MLLLEETRSAFFKARITYSFPFCPQFVMIWTDDTIQLVLVVNSKKVSRVVVVAVMGKL
jgi:hypothetical protein